MKYHLEDKEKKELIDIILKKDVEIEKLKKELEKYKNPNTPSSSHKHLKKNTQGLQSRAGARRGAPRSHKGVTRKQIIDRYEVIDVDECNKCHSQNLKDKKILNRTIEEIPEPVTPETKHSEIHVKECEDCGHVFIPEHNTTPLHGKFGINIMVMVVFLRFLLRGVLRKTANFLESGFALKLTLHI